MMLLPALLASLVAFASAAHPTIAPEDHLLQVLTAIHHSSSFSQLPEREKIILVELIAAAETDTVTHYVDRIGLDRVFQFLDHVNHINQAEAHKLEQYFIVEFGQEETTTIPAVGRRGLQNVINTMTGNAAFQQLSAEDQSLMLNLAKAAENGTVTAYIDQVGYSKVFALVEHISSPAETHIFLHYMSTHIAAELHHHHHNGPVVG